MRMFVSNRLTFAVTLHPNSVATHSLALHRSICTAVTAYRQSKHTSIYAVTKKTDKRAWL